MTKKARRKGELLKVTHDCCSLRTRPTWDPDTWVLDLPVNTPLVALGRKARGTLGGGFFLWVLTPKGTGWIFAKNAEAA